MVEIFKDDKGKAKNRKSSLSTFLATWAGGGGCKVGLGGLGAIFLSPLGSPFGTLKAGAAW